MADARGFITELPTVVYGDSDGLLTPTEISASPFIVPGTGAQNILYLGGSLARSTTDGNVKLAIFEDDAANGCPGAMVSDSATDAIALTSGGISLKYHTYGATKPQVQGGTKYWIATIQDVNIFIRRFLTGGETAYITVTAYTWPADDAWHTNTDYGRDQSLFAVYEAATAQFARPSSDVAGGTFRSILVTAPFGPRVIA
jgi:hypothetical protein